MAKSESADYPAPRSAAPGSARAQGILRLRRPRPAALSRLTGYTRNRSGLHPVRFHKLNSNRLPIKIGGIRRIGLSRAAIGHDHRLGRIDCATCYRGRNFRCVSYEDELVRPHGAELERT